jgi:8-oxo-dGTP pyrophosphatase MutT (NUDIX family)
MLDKIKELTKSDLIVGVGTFIYCVSTHRYLFLLRSASKYSGTWGLAGGKIDAGEQLLIEEIGVDLSTAKVIPIEKFTSDKNKFSYHTFLLPVKEEFVPKLNHEHRGYCWVELGDYPKPLHPGVWRTINFAEVVAKIRTIESIL